MSAPSSSPRRRSAPSAVIHRGKWKGQAPRTGLAEFEGERIAIIALRMGATPEQMAVESDPPPGPVPC